MILAIMLCCASGFDIVTRKGQIYRHVESIKVEPDGIRFSHEQGTAKLPFEELQSDLQKQYGYDPQKAAAFRASVAAEKAEAAEKAAIQERAREDQIAKLKQEEQARIDDKRKHDQQIALNAAAAAESSTQNRIYTERFTIALYWIVGLCVGVLFLWMALCRTGMFLMVMGILIAIYFFVFFDTTVGGYHNAGLLQDRLLGCIGGMVMFIAGLFISLSKKSASN